MEKMSNYLVLDIETPNFKNNSICSIAILEIKNNEIINKYDFLINPEDSFDDFNMKLHGITPNKVKNSPTFSEIWDELKLIIDSNIIVGHNITFDLNVICKSLKRSNLEIPSFKYIDTLILSRQYLDLEKYDLDSISTNLNIELLKHHIAINDCIATFELFKYIINNIDNFEYNVNNYCFNNTKEDKETNNRFVSFNTTTKSMQTLKDIIDVIICDNFIANNEIHKLELWMESNSKELAGHYPFDKLFDIITTILKDNIIDASEHTVLMDIFNQFLNPDLDNKISIIFSSKLFCLSGNFNCGSKNDVKNIISSLGGNISETLINSVDYLIVGGQGNQNWSLGNYGNKVVKALELQEKGKDIKIISEELFCNETSSTKELQTN